MSVSVYEYPKAASPSAMAAIPLSRVQPKKIEAREERRAVFGISVKSLTDDEASGVSVKAGNTLAVAPDDKTLRPGEEASIPIPTEEYLVTQMPAMLSEVRIPYPKEAKEKGIEGPVVMDLLVDAEGVVREVKWIEGAFPVLNEAAIEAVRRCKFRPAKVAEKPVAVRIRYVYRFVLEP